MSFRFARLTALAVVLSVFSNLGLAQSTPAESQERMALTCLGTEMGSTIYFQVRWGSNSSWADTAVEPGKWKVFSYQYEYIGQNQSPQLQVRYDDDSTSGTNWVVTNLNAYAAEQKDCDEGARYNFYQRGQELYIQSEN